MGCSGSKNFRADVLEDSIHVMLKRDDRMAKNQKNVEVAFSARSPHPLLMGQKVICCEEGDESATVGESDISDDFPRCLSETR